MDNKTSKKEQLLGYILDHTKPKAPVVGNSRPANANTMKQSGDNMKKVGIEKL